jgi:serine/threonine-protein kinase
MPAEEHNTFSDTRGALPEEIGRYRIVKRIGGGAMGDVYSAHDQVIGRPVALKILIRELESDPETRARFYREAQAAARLVHPNIITIFDAGEDRGRSFIAMQLLEGLPLTEYLQRPEAVGLERKLDLMIQVCEGLAAAHGQGIVHRDLKPSNLFVQPDGLLKILDFGVARFVDSAGITMAGTLLGTPDYMSPEQARGDAVDARSDIFSAGAVFYFILAGRKPFPSLDFRTVLRQLQVESPAALGAAVPRELEMLILHAMAKKAEDRPKRVEELLTSLVRFRRHYQAETRKLMMTARSSLAALSALVAAIGETASALRLPDDGAETAALERIQQRFPALSGRALAAEAMAIERHHVSAATEELETHHAHLTRLLERHRSHLAQLDAGERALAGGDARAALGSFEAVEAGCRSARARELAEFARPLAVEQEARDAKVAARIAAARTALDSRNWTAAAAECRQALALAPAHEIASALLNEAEQGIAFEQRRSALVTQRLLERARRAIEQKEFDIAEVTLREAEASTPASKAVADLRQHLAAEREAAEAAELLHQLSLEENRRARGVFRRGRYDEAVQQLRGFLEVEPDAAEVARELEQLIALRESLVSSAGAARRKSSELLVRARSLAQAADLTQSLELARAALRADPTDSNAAAAVDDLLTRELEQQFSRARTRALQERAAEVEPLIAAAQRAREHGYLAVALSAALAAQRLLPERTDISQLVDDVRRELASDDEDLFVLGPATQSSPDAIPGAPASDAADTPAVEHAENSGVLDWAAELLRHGLRRGKV